MTLLSKVHIAQEQSRISRNLVVICLFSVLGLTLSAAALSYLSHETISIVFPSIG